MVVEDRFQVCDPVCGLVDTYITLRQALDGARRHSRTCGGDVSTYDVMAHYGQSQEWDAMGRVASVRQKEE